MKNLKKALVMAGCAMALTLGANQVSAQRGGRNFDPAQMRERMMTNFKTEFDVNDEAEWKVLETAIGKVLDAQQDLRTDAGQRFGGGGRRNRGGNGDNNNSDQNAQPPRQRPGAPTPAPEVEDLQKAIEAKASPEEIKAKLGKLRESVKTKEAKLESAREDLKKLLTARQEAVAVLAGLLK